MFKYGLLIIIPINLNNKINKRIKFNRLFVLNMHGCLIIILIILNNQIKWVIFVLTCLTRIINGLDLG